MNELSKYTVREFFKEFYLSNDDAHQISHADDVCDLALTINKKLGDLYSEEYIILASYAHDIYSDELGRKNHHKLAYSYIMNTKSAIFETISDEGKGIIACAVFEHRASYTGDFTSKLSEIISAADRGVPNYKDIYNRALKYAKGDHNQTELHMIDKYGRNGYAKYPDAYIKIFKEELEELYTIIDSLNPETRKDIA
jgi:hypothetical protein